MRSSGGQLLSASALVALGTSVLLAALIGLGLSELRSAPPIRAANAAHSEAAAVVVPPLTVSRGSVSVHGGHADSGTRARTEVVTPAVAAPIAARPATAHSSGSSTAGARTSTAATRATSTSTSTPTAAASPTPKRGHGKGHPHGKPAKH